MVGTLVMVMTMVAVVQLLACCRHDISDGLLAGVEPGDSSSRDCESDFWCWRSARGA
ncbi:MAG: hypothetical protein GY813_15190 [Halieaceae bacterium]|nr:hypothetical protein [Halieaceae bacterium]